MRLHEYLDFDLVIEADDGRYVARVLNSPAGQASAEVTLPFTSDGLENFVLKMGPARAGVRRIGSAQIETAQSFGRQLYDAVFAGEVGTCFRRSLDEAERAASGLRVRLRLGGVPALAEVPWECLYSEGLGRFVVVSTDTPLVRFLDLPSAVRPIAITPPLRVLVMVSNPVDVVSLDVDRELALLRDATADLAADGRLELVPMEDASLPSLQRSLRRADYHVLHFIGHGGFDAAQDDGVLVLEDASQRAKPVSGGHLGTLLHDHHSLRLAVLNACEGARPSREDPFSGVAQSLIRQGLPGVIAMQFEITDEAATVFGHEFYLALADGYPVDAALGEARKAMFAAGHQVEWATPVLYLRASDGRLFDIAARAAPPPVEAPPEGPAPEALPVEAPPPDAPPVEAPPEAPPVSPPAPIVPPVPPAPPEAPPPEPTPERAGKPPATHPVPPLGIAAAVVVGALAVIGIAFNMIGGPTPSTSPSTSPSVPPSAVSPTSSAAQTSLAPTGTASVSPLPPPVWTSISAADHFASPFSQAAVAEHLGEIWIVGAEGSNRQVNHVAIFDPRTKRWRSGPALERRIRHGSLVSDSRSLYFIGGYDQQTGEVLRSVYRLDPPDGTWTEVANLLRPRHSGAAAWDGDRIVFGGGAPDRVVRAAASDVYAFEAGAWTHIAGLNAPREHFAAATDGAGRVWFAGGIDTRTGKPSDLVDVVQGNSASEQARLGLARQGAAVMWSPGTGLCVIGGSRNAPTVGRDTARYSKSVECAAGELPDLPLERYGAAAVVLGKDLYVIGGFDSMVDGTPDITVDSAILTLRLP